MKKQQRLSRPSRQRMTGLLGGALFVLGMAGFAWIFFSQAGATQSIAGLPIPGFLSSSELQTPALQKAGITLTRTSQQPALSKQQAIFIAAQLEPVAASNARSTSAHYMLMSLAGTDGPVKRAALKNVPVWIIWYQKIPTQPNDARVDPTPFSQPTHDLYIFLDATSGKALLSLWA